MIVLLLRTNTLNRIQEKVAMRLPATLPRRGVSLPAVRPIETQADLSRRLVAGIGFIYNDNAGAGDTGGESNILHAAGCSSMRNSRVTNYPKYFAQDITSAVTWLNNNRGQENTGWRRCGICNPA